LYHPNITTQRATNNTTTGTVLWKSGHHFVTLHGHNYAAPSVPPVKRTRINQSNVLLRKLEKTRIEEGQEEQSDEEKMGN
jgi:hypothetical protein